MSELGGQVLSWVGALIILWLILCRVYGLSVLPL